MAQLEDQPLYKYTASCAADSCFGIPFPGLSFPLSYRRSDRNLLGSVKNTVSEPNVTSLKSKFSTETFYIIRKRLSSEVLSPSLLFPSLPPGFNSFPGQFPYSSNYFYPTCLGNVANATLSASTLRMIAQYFILCGIVYFMIKILDVLVC